MNPLFYKRPFVPCLYAAFCLVATATQVCAQGQQRPTLLALKACGRELRVFEDGALVETRRGKTAQRRLPEGRMRRLRELIARRPCIKEWQPPASSPPVPTEGEVKLSTVYDGDCMAGWLSYGGGLDEIQVTVRSPDGQVGPFPVYIVCDGASERYKRSARRDYGRFLKPAWRRFVADISKAVGGKSFLKGCDCWQT